MNDIIRRLKTVLSDTGLYSGDENTLVYAELSAYALALSKLRFQINELFSRIFIQDADDECLRHWEELFNISIPLEKDDEIYWEILTSMFYMNDAYDHYRSFYTLIYIYQLFGLNIDFDFISSTVFFSDSSYQSIFDCTDACRMFEKTVPAYVRYCADIEPPDFGALDGFDYTFEQIDAYNLPWGVVKDE